MVEEGSITTMTTKSSIFWQIRRKKFYRRFWGLMCRCRLRAVQMSRVRVSRQVQWFIFCRLGMCYIDYKPRFRRDLSVCKLHRCVEAYAHIWFLQDRKTGGEWQTRDLNVPQFGLFQRRRRARSVLPYGLQLDSICCPDQSRCAKFVCHRIQCTECSAWKFCHACHGLVLVWSGEVVWLCWEEFGTAEGIG